VGSHDFSQPLEYEVVSRNKRYRRAYAAEVEYVSIGDAAPWLLWFRFSASLNPALTRDAEAEIEEGKVSVELYYAGEGAPRSLAPEFGAEGLVKALGAERVSGMGSQDFTRRISYRVTNPLNPLLSRDYAVEARFIRDGAFPGADRAF
jgi:hypothetical protein